MGNRAVITQTTNANAPCIYLHWNGGRSSVEAFLACARGFDIVGTGAAVMDNLAEMIAKHFFECDVGMTVYRETYGKADTDNWDNGVYVIDNHMRIIGRQFFEGKTEQTDQAQFNEIIRVICNSVKEEG